MSAPLPAILLHEARATLLLAGRPMHTLVEVSQRTVQRWLTGASEPAASQKITLARALHPLDATLSAQFAAAGGETLESLGLVAPRLASAAIVSVPLRRVVDAIVYAAAEAGELPVGMARQAVLAALRCMSETGLGVDTVLGGLTEPQPTRGTRRAARAAAGARLSPAGETARGRP